MNLSDLGEFGFIDRISGILNTADERVIKGIGDDCAVVRLTDDRVQVITTDAFVENIHFLTDRIAAEQLGHKCLAVNLSDVAAMGAEPTFAVVTVASPASRDAEYLTRMFFGIRALADRFGVTIVGGDMTSSQRDLMISITALGEARADEIRYRSAAHPDDVLFVTGVIGESGAGLATLLDDTHARQMRQETLDALRSRHLTPEPLMGEGRWLARYTGPVGERVGAMLDVSDGIASDIRHICRESSAQHGAPIGVRIDEAELPITATLAEFLDRTGGDPIQYQLQSGEDYALLFSAPESTADDLMDRFRAEFATQIARIGIFTGDDRYILHRCDGSEYPLSGGHDHFRHG